jgi:hypothetical protein
MVEDKTILICFVCLGLLIGGSLWNIYHFMPIEQSCHDEFDLINKCHCVPCNSPLIEIFELPKCNDLAYDFQINLSNG